MHSILHKVPILTTRAKALKLLEESGCAPNVIQHCKEVASLAVEIADKIKAAGHEVDSELVEVGALLHDFGRCRTHEITHAVRVFHNRIQSRFLLGSPFPCGILRAGFDHRPGAPPPAAVVAGTLLEHLLQLHRAAQVVNLSVVKRQARRHSKFDTAEGPDFVYTLTGLQEDGCQNKPGLGTRNAENGARYNIGRIVHTKIDPREADERSPGAHDREHQRK